MFKSITPENEIHENYKIQNLFTLSQQFPDHANPIIPNVPYVIPNQPFLRFESVLISSAPLPFHEAKMPEKWHGFENSIATFLKAVGK